MTSPLDSALLANGASMADQSSRHLQASLSTLDAGNGSDKAKAKKLREACEGFESLFIQRMWQEMRKTVPQGGMFQGREEKFWQDMYDQELAKSMSQAGGIGLADMMYEQLSRNLGDASRVAAGQSAAQAFVPTAAPLLPSPAVYAQLGAPEEESAPVMTTIYEQEAPQTGAVPDVEETPVAAAPVAPAAAPAQAERPHRSAPVINDGANAINQSYLASREAHDKLAPGAIRPALRPRPQQKAAPEATAQPPAPGSAENLKAALAAAQTGAPEPGHAASSLEQLVASAMARNAAVNPVQPTPPTEEAAPADDAAPTVVRVRYQTNIPQTSKGKTASDAIKVLNATSAARAQTPPLTAGSASAVGPVIQPEAGFAIPPLRPGSAT